MKWGNWPIFSYVGGGGHREVGYNFLAKLIESDTDQMVLCLLCTWKTFKRELYLFHFLLLLPLKGVLLWIYISFSESVGESCRQKWKWIFSKIHLILWFFKKILCYIYFLTDNFWLIWNPWRCSNIWTTTTISTKKYQKLILSDRYRFITRQDEGGWDWKSVENMIER